MNLYRRHRKNCSHRKKGRKYTGCNCPIWADGDRNGRQFRVSLKLRDWQRAIRKLAQIEDPDAKPQKLVAEAIAAWESQLSVQEPSLLKYKRLMRQLRDFCERNGIETVSALGLEQLDAFRVGRKVSRMPAAKELQTLRQFFSFCFERGWAKENYARKIKTPKAQPKEVVPYTPQQAAEMLASCDAIGQNSYERLRARTLVLLLRFTGLRIMYAVTLDKDRIRPDGRRGWQIQLFTQKTKGHVTLPIPVELKNALDALPFPMRENGSQVDSGYFFWSGSGKKSSARGIAERLLGAVFEKAKVEGAHAHRFRHTLATDILARGGSMADVADVLGIGEHVARKHYAKWSQARQERINALLQAVYSGISGGHEKNWQ